MLLLVLVGVWIWWTDPQPRQTRDILPGIAYSCELFDEPEIVGRAHIVIVDLATPGLQLYVTPVDPQAERMGWEYRTTWVPSAVHDLNLAVAINGTYFEQRGAFWKFWPGQLARSADTVVSAGIANRVDPASYLLWFEEDLTPHLETSRPPADEVIQQAEVGIGGKLRVIDRGRVSDFAARGRLAHEIDARTLMGLDPKRKYLYLAVFECASEHRASEVLAGYGATDALILDGGSSSCLAFGRDVHDVPRSTIVFPQHAVATIFGVGYRE